MPKLITLIVILALIVIFSKFLITGAMNAIEYEGVQSETYREQVCSDAEKSPIINQSFIEMNCQ